MIVIQHLDQLARLIALSLKEIKELTCLRERFYYDKKIPKRDGSVRLLRVPFGKLKTVQRKIYLSILRHIPLPGYIHSQVGHSHVDHALTHLGQDVILTFDIKDFFPSITQEQVKMALNKNGCSYVVAKMIALLCASHGRLPQGTSTSPSLATIVATKLDHRLSNLCSQHGWIYSRFADDIAISGNINVTWAKQLIQKIIESESLVVKQNKIQTIFANKNDDKKLVGIRFHGNRITAPRLYYKNLVAMIHKLNHESSRLPPSKLEKLRNGIQSKLAYGLYIEKRSGCMGKFTRLAKKITLM